MKFGPLNPRLRSIEAVIETLPILNSGLYTPTITNTTNVAASIPYECQWAQINDKVWVSGKVDIDPTLVSVDTEIGISLPVPSDFGAEEQCGGSANTYALASVSAAIYADVVNNRARLRYLNLLDVTNKSWFFYFMYRVIP